MNGNEIERKIIHAVKTLCSRDRLGTAVLPLDVCAFCDEFGIYAVEATIRRHMARLADEGRLVRVGERKGYMVPDWRTSLTPYPSPKWRGDTDHYDAYSDVG